MESSLLRSGGCSKAMVGWGQALFCLPHSTVSLAYLVYPQHWPRVPYKALFRQRHLRGKENTPLRQLRQQTVTGHQRKGQRKWVWPAEADLLKITKAKFFLNLQPCLQLHFLSPRLATELEFLLLEVSHGSKASSPRQMIKTRPISFPYSSVLEFEVQ